MQHWLHRLLCASTVLLVLTAVGGCARERRQIAPAQPLVVPVSLPIQRMVTDYADYPGRTEAVQLTDVRARVTGYLVDMPFQEGAEVKGPEDRTRLAAGTLGLLGTPHHLGPLHAVSSL